MGSGGHRRALLCGQNPLPAAKSLGRTVEVAIGRLKADLEPTANSKPPRMRIEGGKRE